MKNVTDFRNKLERLATVSGDAEYHGSLGAQKFIQELINEITYDYIVSGENQLNELAKREILFKAKPLSTNTDSLDPDDVEWFHEMLDDEGFISGWYSDGYIIGNVIEADDEYIIHEFWCPVDKSTLQLGGFKDEQS